MSLHVAGHEPWYSYSSDAGPCDCRRECDDCGRQGAYGDASTTEAYCARCQTTRPFTEDVCGACGSDSLVLACPDCGGEWLPLDDCPAPATQEDRS